MVRLRLDPDPVVEAYKRDIDRTLIRENLKLTVEERFLKAMSLARFAEELRRAVRGPRPEPPMTDFAALLTALGNRNVAFIVVDGAAAIAHGSARLTQDLDIVYDRSRDNVDRLVAALAGLNPYLCGAPPGLPFSWSRQTIERGLNFTLVTSLGDIDLLGEIPGGGGYGGLEHDAIALELFQTRCLCLSLEQLIRAKRAAGRPKDLEALAELEAIADGAGWL